MCNLSIRTRSDTKTQPEGRSTHLGQGLGDPNRVITIRSLLSDLLEKGGLILWQWYRRDQRSLPRRRAAPMHPPSHPNHTTYLHRDLVWVTWELFCQILLQRPLVQAVVMDVVVLGHRGGYVGRRIGFEGKMSFVPSRL